MKFGRIPPGEEEGRLDLVRFFADNCPGDGQRSDDFFSLTLLQITHLTFLDGMQDGRSLHGTAGDRSASLRDDKRGGGGCHKEVIGWKRGGRFSAVDARTSALL